MTAVCAHAAAASSALVESKHFEKGPIVLMLLIPKINNIFMCWKKSTFQFYQLFYEALHYILLVIWNSESNICFQEKEEKTTWVVICLYQAKDQ